MAWLAAWQVVTSGTTGLTGEAGLMAWAVSTMIAVVIVFVAAVIGTALGVWLLARDRARPSTIVGLAVNILTLLAAAALWRPN